MRLTTYLAGCVCERHTSATPRAFWPPNHTHHVLSSTVEIQERSLHPTYAVSCVRSLSRYPTSVRGNIQPQKPAFSKACRQFHAVVMDSGNAGLQVADVNAPVMHSLGNGHLRQLQEGVLSTYRDRHGVIPVHTVATSFTLLPLIGSVRARRSHQGL
jgi:hypothetical protein